MAIPTTTDLAKLANLQIGAECFLVSVSGTLFSGDDLVAALKRGNDHSSKFTASQATAFAATWQVVAQQPNTASGFSGTLFKCIKDDPTTGAKKDELVISMRSTEFIDDAVRDNLTCNTLEIKNTGFAWGQISDMQAWYQSLISSAKMGVSQPFTLTGYSLGGHLATAFNLLNPIAATQTVTFNGAGVGQLKDGTLLSALTEFNSLKSSPLAIASKLNDSALAAKYNTIRTNLNNGSCTADQARASLSSLPASAMRSKLETALNEITQIGAQIARLTTLQAGGGDNPSAKPKPIAIAEIAAAQLDYRMTVQLVSAQTQAASLPQGAQQAVTGKPPGLSIPWGYTALLNHYDVVADTWPSVVANSQGSNDTTLDTDDTTTLKFDRSAFSLRAIRGTGSANDGRFAWAA